MDKRTTLILLLLTVVLLSACGGAAPESPTMPAQTEQPVVDGATLLQDRCTACHGPERVTAVQQTQAEWEHTVGHMVEHGAELNQAEQATLVAYLAQTYGP